MTENELIQYYSLTIEEGEDTWYKGVYTYGKEIYDFGSIERFEPPKNSFKPFFKKAELKHKYKEQEFYVITKDFLSCIINVYTNRIQKYYLDMVQPFFENENNDFLDSIKMNYSYPNNNVTFDFNTITQNQQNALYKMIKHIKDMSMEWNQLFPFDLNDNKEKITDSWKFEYAIFELVRIYKSFDWKKNVMIYYGF